ncbi:iron-sulfur oxidoreductase [Acetobacter nitrogenifigens DSM 23921 = NBRC 105050]|uniref:Glycolate oxidase n=2 Tax=Acetobacter TaxID=434 RepID=A0A511XEH9_9PROT|nr:MULTISPECIES: (Fe-S)-binding protein [Acetobacter]MBO1361964.1 (Fe-S)-binding protein [Acetobacter sacchari]GBQ99602.1 iron-sulfur oxidoreductase [Acetobacter nitrogenifigens DSM 23921 = NBRC 105050]GEN61372.1 glycolate oxidase [Acetobacter nitrogenifigens DSM 23921 = NBRC 105050]
MRVGLFVPCYVDAFHPEVGQATLELLERFGLDVDYPFDQTCCGQPMTNTGCHEESRATEELFVKNFSEYDYIVAPSGSCVNQVRRNFTALEQTEEVTAVRAKTFELVEFLHDILKVDAFPWAEFPHKVALHNNCNALRGLSIASMSELRNERFSKPKDLLGKVRGLEFVDIARPDECCGFGGTFSVFEEGISSRMGQDKARDQARSGADYVTSSDSSCLMHQEGCARRLQLGQKYIHISQILNGSRA